MKLSNTTFTPLLTSIAAFAVFLALFTYQTTSANPHNHSHESGSHSSDTHDSKDDHSHNDDHHKNDDSDDHHSEEGSHHSDSSDEAHEHSHSPLEVEAEGAPQVSVTLLRDTVKGYTVEVETENFFFTPDEAGGSHEPNEGHAHVYINGEKSGRIYGNFHYLPEVVKGDEVRVTLNSNDHRDYTVDGERVEDTATAN